jgi:hypothetical protein
MSERADEVRRDDEPEGDADFGDTAPDDTVNEGQDENVPNTGQGSDPEGSGAEGA